MTNQPDSELPEQAMISSLQQVEALDSPLRMRILKAAADPGSVREIAEALGVPPTRLYYHINMLEAAGFLTVVAERKSGARLEKIYRVAARSFAPGPELRNNVDDLDAAAAALANLVLGPTRAEAEIAIGYQLRGHSDEEAEVGRSLTRLTPPQVQEIKSRLQTILDEVVRGDEDDPAARPYSFTFLLLPTDLEKPD